MSGNVTVDSACVPKWEEIKLKKLKACNFKILDYFEQRRAEIIVDEGSEIQLNTPDAWNQWVSSLPDREGRYAIYNAELKVEEAPGVFKICNKPIFIQWIPSAARIKHKMICTSSMSALKMKLEGLQMSWQITTKDDLDPSVWIEDLNNRLPGKTIIAFEGQNAK